MAYNFPASPAVGDTYTSPDGKLTYGYNGFAWDMKAKTAAAQRPELIELHPFLMEVRRSRCRAARHRRSVDAEHHDHHHSRRWD